MAHNLYIKWPCENRQLVALDLRATLERGRGKDFMLPFHGKCRINITYISESFSLFMYLGRAIKILKVQQTETPNFLRGKPFKKKGKPRDCKFGNIFTVIEGLQIISFNKLECTPNISPTYDAIQIYSRPIFVEFPHLFDSIYFLTCVYSTSQKLSNFVDDTCN